MPTADQRQAAADLLWRLSQTGEAVDALPEELTPRSRAEAYAVQSLIEPRSAKPVFGWKIAATSRAGQIHIGIDGPIAGRLLAEQVFAAGVELPFGANRLKVAEAEFVFRFARDLPPRAVPHDVDEVIAAVASLHPGIEIPDCRLVDYARVGAFQLIADNACAHQFVLGPPTAADWRAMDLAAHTVHATVAGKLERDGTGANVLGDPRLALTWLANELSGLGVPLRAGQVVTTGTCTTPLPIAAGDGVSADFGGLGAIGVRFSTA
jgi:2-keto-4-pentenoate hydratase